MTRAAIHPQLLLDTHLLGNLPISRLLLHRNAVVPWFILVPAADAENLLDLSGELLGAVMSEAQMISEFVKKTFGCTRINFAGIGNIVPQLHLHIVGRRPDDPCWPAPVWGNLRQQRHYSAAELGRIVEQLQLYAPERFAV